MRGNRGARSAGIDGVKPRSIVFGEAAFLTGLRHDLKSGGFTPLPVRQRMIPKANGKLRSLGIPTASDRVVQASVELVLEPIFEAGFRPRSYWFRPCRRAHEAIAKIHMLASNEYPVVLEGAIEACFDEIDHTALMSRVRDRVGDKRVVGLVRARCRCPRRGWRHEGHQDGHPARRHSVTVACQHCVVSPRRSFRRGMAT